MDRVLIEQKLESLRHCVQRVSEKCPAELKTLMEDADLQDIVVFNLTRAVQLGVDIASHIIATSGESAPTTMGQAFSTLAKLGVIDELTVGRMKKSVGFRNIAVHNYEDVDWGIVHAICVTHLDDFREFARCVAAYSSRPEPG